MSEPNPPRKVVVIGALSAIAEATARLLAADRASFILLGRRRDRLDTLSRDLLLRGAACAEVIEMDLDRAETAPTVFATARAAMGGLDTVLLFYGSLGDQIEAERNLEAARAILRTNFESAADWVMAAANALQSSPSKRGVLGVVSSVAGDRGRRSNYLYGAAKGGLAILTQGVAHRFAALPEPRPRAIVFKLGFVDTPMTAHILNKGLLWATPDAVAATIVRSLNRSGPVVYAPSFWRWIMLVIRATPAAIFDKINI